MLTARAKRVPLIAVVGLLVGFGSAPAAVADTDPAGTYLLGNQVFLSSQPAPVSPAQRQLLVVVREANQAGFEIRVAIVPSQYDLGSVPQLWRRPQAYAGFLETELSPSYRGRLLVVMPNGLGFSWPGMATAPNSGPLRDVTVSAGADGLAEAADSAVRRLAAAAGLTLAPAPTPRGASARTSSADLLRIVGGSVSALAASLALAILLLRARRRLGAWRDRRRAANGSALSGRFRWALPGSAVCALAVATPLVLMHRGSRDFRTAETPAVKAPLLSWPAGRRAAPGFVLRDQDGKQVSLAAYRNRPVIVTFVDPLCRNLCPLEAQVLNQAEREMPRAQRPVILAVSVDVSGDARSHLLQDVQEWHLVPQWRWAVGRSAQLASVWNKYGVTVKVTTQRIAGVTTINIAHTEAAYVIDATGHERAVFAWPFYLQDVERVLRQLA